MSIESDFNNNNPNGIIDREVAQGERLFNKLRDSSDKASASLSGYIRAQREIADLEKQIKDVEAVSNKASKDSQATMRAYLDSLKRQLEEERDAFKNTSEAVEETFGAGAIKNIEALKEEVNKAFEEVEKKSDEELERLEKKREEILKSDDSISEKNKKISEIDKQIKAEKTKRESIDESKERILSGKSGINTEKVISGLGKNSILGSFLSWQVDKGEGDKWESRLDRVVDRIPGVKNIDHLVDTAKQILSALGTLRQTMTKSIENAANTMANYYGTIQANLEGTGLNYESISTDVDAALGISRLVKQTDYLNEIAKLTNQGLVTDVEQRALLETIKNKTLTSFDVANAGLLRLIRLGEQNTTNQFGVELQLKRLLNSPVFGDSSYLQNLFDSVTSALIDVSTMTKADVTNFNSTVQTWLGAMYSQGLSDSVVSSIAKGINALGSGNVSELAQDESLQRLFLLAMDRINMDYADVLQQGLSSEDTSNLLASVVKYLAEISKNTEDNLVLKSSYSNLFNMSVSDMQAIQNMSTKIDSITNAKESPIIGSQGADDITRRAITNNLVKNTMASEQFENFLSNVSYSFGSNIAENKTAYSTYRLAGMISDVLDNFSNFGGAIGKAVKLLSVVPKATQFGIAGYGLVKMLTDTEFQSFSNNPEKNTLVNLLGKTFISNSKDSVSSYSSTSDNYTSKTSDSTSAFKSFISDKADDLTKNISANTETWQKEGDDEIVGLLQQFTKTLMRLNTNENDLAVAVSLEGMNDNVLRSFASIFADEDAMENTFTGKNGVLDDALFGYFDDNTSSSNGKNNKGDKGGK